jgi:hypothetical protein
VTNGLMMSASAVKEYPAPGTQLHELSVFLAGSDWRVTLSTTLESTGKYTLGLELRRKAIMVTSAAQHSPAQTACYCHCFCGAQDSTEGFVDKRERMQMSCKLHIFKVAGGPLAPATRVSTDVSTSTCTFGLTTATDTIYWTMGKGVELAPGPWRTDGTVRVSVSLQPL